MKLLHAIKSTTIKTFDTRELTLDVIGKRINVSVSIVCLFEECSQQAFSKSRSNMDHTAFRGLYPMNTAIRNVYCWVRTRETSGEVGALCCRAGNGD